MMCGIAVLHGITPARDNLHTQVLLPLTITGMLPVMTVGTHVCNKIIIVMTFLVTLVWWHGSKRHVAVPMKLLVTTAL